MTQVLIIFAVNYRLGALLWQRISNRYDTTAKIYLAD